MMQSILFDLRHKRSLLQVRYFQSAILSAVSRSIVYFKVNKRDGKGQNYMCLGGGGTVRVPKSHESCKR
jgi:hypothetical protein